MTKLRFSPSAAERWLCCPGSVRLCAALPPAPSNQYAEEGTAAHAVLEGYLRETFAATTWAADAWAREWPLYAVSLPEMSEHADGVIEYVESLLAHHGDDVRVIPEVKYPIDLGSGVVANGIIDILVHSDTRLDVIDFKYGSGVQVSAADNPQLMLYAAGALQAIGLISEPPEEVHLTILQPRREHVSTWETTATEVQAWMADTVRPAVELASTGDAPFGPGAAACRWCPASGQCTAQADASLGAVRSAGYPSRTPGSLDNDQLATLLPELDLVSQWVKDARAVAVARMSGGESIPGHKLVRTNGRRYITDQVAALDCLVDEHGYDIEDVSKRALRGIGELEKLMGKARFEADLADYIDKSQGSPVIASLDDPRPSIGLSLEEVFPDD